MDTLVAEDLLLLLMDDETGRLAAASHARALFGGALLVELALVEAVDVEEKRGFWHSAKVLPASDAPPLADPLLQRARATVAEKPRTAQDLVQRIGKGVREELQDRLVGRGVLERRERKVLGLFPSTTWPAADVTHEREVRQRLEAVLVQGLDPEPRTAALVALLSAVDQAHRVVSGPGVPTREVKKRARRIAEGEWAAKAVKDAVVAAQTAVTAAVVASGSAAAASS